MGSSPFQTKRTQIEPWPANPGLETQVNRDYEMPIYIDYPQPTASNVSERRAAFYATLPNRIDIPFMTRIEAMNIFGPLPPPHSECAFTRRRAAEKRNFRRVVRFAAIVVGVL